MKLRYALLFLFSLLMTASGLATLPPLDRDEPRFVQATKQMVESGDYVDIRFQDMPRYQKPIGIYWLQAAAVTLSGQGAQAPIWIYRLVSALAIAAAVVAIAWTGTNLFGANAGIAAGLVLTAIFATAFEGRDAKTDAALLACCVFAQGALAQIYMASRRNEAVAAHLPWIFWIAQGFGLLIKGPLAPLLSALTVIALLVFERDGRWLARLKPWRGLLIMALIVLPWVVLITLKSGVSFWQGSVENDFLEKAVPGGAPHWAPPGYYVLTYSLFMWPFGLIALGAEMLAINRVWTDYRLRFCLAWYVPFWLLFELVPTKLPHYVMPAYPGLILLIGWLLTLGPEERTASLKKWQNWCWWAGALGFGLVTAAIAVVSIGAPVYLTGQVSPWGLFAALTVLATGYFAVSRNGAVSLRRIAMASVFAGVSAAILFGIVIPSLTPIWMTPRIVAAVQAAQPCGNSVLASSEYREPSLVFMLGTKTLLTNLKGAEDHVSADPACALALVPVRQGNEFAGQLSQRGLAVQRVAVIDGYNFSSGDTLSLGLYRAASQQ